MEKREHNFKSFVNEHNNKVVAFRAKVVICLFFILALTSSCAYRKSLITHTNIKNCKIPLFIQLPENKFVFDNLAPLVYETMIQRFARVGYYLVNERKNGYLLKISIKSLDPQTKFVSPDVLLFHVRMKIVLLCELFNFNNTLITTKTFHGTTLISKPIDPILKSDFFYFEYKKILSQSKNYYFMISFFSGFFLLNTFYLKLYSNLAPFYFLLYLKVATLTAHKISIPILEQNHFP